MVKHDASDTIVTRICEDFSLVESGVMVNESVFQGQVFRDMFSK